MSDLIRRQSVIDLLKNSTSRDIEEVVITEKHINLIKDMPVAYDVEKVVAELKETNKNEVNAGVCPNGFVHCLTAIDIVKRGGVE